MINKQHNFALGVLLFAYLFALLTSMSLMEFFGWTTALVTTYVLWKNKTPEQKWPFFKIGPDYFLWGLWLVVIIGFIINIHSLPVKAGLFSFRWIILFYFLTYAFYLKFPSSHFFKYFLIFIALISLYAISQFFFGYDLVRSTDRAVHRFGNYFRSFGFFSSPMTFGNAYLLVFFFPLSLTLIPDPKEQRWFKILAIITTALVGISLLTSQTRGAWIGAFFGVAIVSFLISRKLFLRMATAALVFVGLMYSFVLPFRERFAAALDFSRNDNLQRINIWNMNFKMFLDHPLFGVGHFRNIEVLPQYYAKYGIESNFVSEAHNFALQWLSGTGLLGFICFFAFIGFILFISLRLWKNNQLTLTERRILLASIGAQIAFIFSGLTECNFDDAEVKHTYLAYLSIALALYHCKKRPEVICPPK